MLGIIDYNMGNLASVYNACSKFTKDLKIVKNADDLKNLDKIILPGVGAYKDAMQHLEDSGLKDAILDFANSKKPLLGICLGMQLLFESSEEFGYTKGLGLIEGKVVKFDKSKMGSDLKIPHMGWNKIVNKDNPLFKNLQNPYLYFVHSYHVVTDDKYTIATTNYGYDFVSAVNKDNIFGFQPHPEKSHNNGLKILENFINL
ncbi:imidazole glycerol phosphate synthase subunit HisH [Arcobacter cryaerophilus gv. pseudocryaerophilus]|jgi:glutamine amidotransferase|uniref:Imidazole glycerol phosphate synthase subunit HisH n=3 Tax=Arcobacteraceae TaxID=2808963 RepID=A0AA96DSU5_9BACT|nr:imidazole glycerol phosphate synthase subunit HisH [Aliarcobacter cryaerophilus]WNL33667.1 imidazole glycerol phosphate synthase subunit HisH [Arcobacter sp. AZ-2023]WPD12570.1 imidazole glycerol phosphate synthase subunit HisH [Arcobacter sp. DSM 115960]MCT7539197.1 imidazole glycerol phosphate synthase subunit HisH [Aliarcobacter cryaerophilus]QNK84531.1 imidazole glycerol phosphate synthase subunit HisH [Aliarcobacter cryaerophilus]WNL36854.1 imidazole glycerol phosphate synthase subunit